MTRTLQRRLARLEERLPPDGEPYILHIAFVDRDGKVTGTRTIEFPGTHQYGNRPRRVGTVGTGNGLKSS